MVLSSELAGELIEAWYRAGLAAVEPSSAVRRHLVVDEGALVVDGRRIEVPGRLVVLAVGKAASGMARGVLHVCADLIAEGVVITKEGHGGGVPGERLELFAAGHPIPDERGERATRRVLEMVGGLEVGDVLLTLISGGGSALLEAPRAPVTLTDLATTTDLLMRAGAPIEDLNAVRRALSEVKAGGIRRLAGQAAVVTLILSDVAGNDPRVIASGPTIGADPASRDVAIAVLDRYAVRGRVSPAVREVLTRADEAGDSGLVDVGRDCVLVIGDNETAVQAAVEATRGVGLEAAVVWRDAGGEAASAGRAWIDACRAAPATVDVLLGGGETTVTVRGDGVGGRNTEFALAAALALAEGEGGWVVASLATDGQDGPTGVAGAIADGGTVARAAAAGVDAEAALARNDSLRVFEAAGGIVRPGPTGTNVNDLYFGVRVNGQVG